MPDPFIDTPRFPDKISRGSGGTPTWKTDIIETEGGFEYRNMRWSQARHTYDAHMGVKRASDLEQLRAFFHATRGRAYSFRFKDWHDYKSCDIEDEITSTDQVVGTGDGTLQNFQLVKRYVTGAFEYVREIYKPVTSTVIAAVDGADVVSTVGANGRLLLPVIPAVGAIVSAGFEFDVPVRFASDELDQSYEAYRAGTANVTLVEVRVK